MQGWSRAGMLGRFQIVSQPSSWLENDLESGYGLDHLPLGVAESGVVVRVGDFVLPLEPLASRSLVRPVPSEVLARQSLGRSCHRGARCLSDCVRSSESPSRSRPLDPVAATSKEVVP